MIVLYQTQVNFPPKSPLSDILIDSEKKNKIDSYSTSKFPFSVSKLLSARALPARTVLQQAAECSLPCVRVASVFTKKDVSSEGKTGRKVRMGNVHKTLENKDQEDVMLMS